MDSGVIKVLEHCHLTGRFRSSTCQGCNLRLCIERTLTIYAHHGSAFDNSFIFEFVANDQVHVRNITDMIHKHGTKFITFTLWFRCDECVAQMQEKKKKKKNKKKKKKDKKEKPNETKR